MAGEYSSGSRLQVGSCIRGYQVERVFDAGQFAFACEAVDEGGRRVFLKKYKQPGMYSDWYDAFARHQMELRGRIAADAVARTLCDEFIECFSHEKVEAAGRKRALYVIYGLIEHGRDLAGHLASVTDPGEVELARRLVFARVLVAAVHAVHQCGITHADLKPENVMLIPDAAVATGFRVRLIDFDFSLLHGQDAPWHRQISVGTPGYWSPEHLRGEVPVPASDVFTCGVMLVQMLTGRHPCEGSMDRFDELARSGALPPFELPRVIEALGETRPLARVLAACLRPEPTARPSARELLEALNGKLPVFEENVMSPIPRPKPAAASGSLRIGAPDQPMEILRADRVVDEAFMQTWYPALAGSAADRPLLRVRRVGDGRWMVEAPEGQSVQVDGRPLRDPRELSVDEAVRVGFADGRVLVLKADPAE